MPTEGLMESNLSFPDPLFEMGPTDFLDSSAHGVFTANANGDISWNLGASLAATYAGVATPLRKKLRFATPALDQEQFGTAAAQPGPSAVANTSGPLSLKPGFPPLLGAQMPTMGAIQVGPIAKGFQIDSIDVCYQFLAVNGALAQFGLYLNKIVNGAANAPVAVVALGVNGLSTNFTANPVVTNIVNPAPSMIVTPDTFITAMVNQTTAAAASAKFWGLEIYGHINYN